MRSRGFVAAEGWLCAVRSDLIEAGLNEAAWLLLWGKRGGQRCDGGASVKALAAGKNGTARRGRSESGRRAIWNRDIATVADDLGPDLDQLPSGGWSSTNHYGLRRRQRRKKITESVGERMKLKLERVGRKRST